LFEAKVMVMTGELHVTRDEWLPDWNPVGAGKFHKKFTQGLNFFRPNPAPDKPFGPKIG
jgi:hypothetical protein